MGQYDKTTRFLAAMLCGGGIVGVATAIVVGSQLVQQSWLLVFPMSGLAAVFTWAAFTGVALWRGTTYGRKWGTILFASQIPVLAIPGIEYQWFTGAHFSLAMKLGNGAIGLGLSFDFGAKGKFFFGTGVTEFALGINLFAVIAVMLLVRSNNSLKPTALHGVA